MSNGKFLTSITILGKMLLLCTLISRFTITNNNNKRKWRHCEIVELFFYLTIDDNVVCVGIHDIEMREIELSYNFRFATFIPSTMLTIDLS